MVLTLQLPIHEEGRPLLPEAEEVAPIVTESTEIIETPVQTPDGSTKIVRRKKLIKTKRIKKGDDVLEEVLTQDMPVDEDDKPIITEVQEDQPEESMGMYKQKGPKKVKSKLGETPTEEKPIVTESTEIIEVPVDTPEGIKVRRHKRIVQKKRVKKGDDVVEEVLTRELPIDEEGRPLITEAEEVAPIVTESTEIIEEPVQTPDGCT